MRGQMSRNLHRVYEEINIQNTGDTDYAEQIIFKGGRYMVSDE